MTATIPVPAPPALTHAVEHTRSVAGWRESVGRVHTRLTFDVEAREAFHASSAATSYGALRACDFRGSALTARRTRADVGRDGDGTSLLLWQVAGASTLRQGSHEAVLSPGRIAFLDRDAPYEVRCSDGFAQVVVEVPTEHLGAQLALRGVRRDVRGRALEPVGPALPWLAFLRTALVGSQEEPGAFAPLYDATLGALAELGALLAAEAGGESPEDALRREALVILRREHADHDLSAERVAGALAVSRRTLFRAFDGTGGTFSEALQQIRLEAAATLLRRPDSTLSVDAIARAVGYAAPSSFHARFAEAFGAPPGAYRRRHRDGTALSRRDPGTEPEERADHDAYGDGHGR